MGGFSGAVLIARRDTVILRKGYGYADVEQRVPFTPQTRQPIASISKMFTAMAALKLQDQGRLALNDGIARILPDCPEAWRAVTVLYLLRHTSGIPDYEASLELGSAKYFELMTRPDASTRIMANATTLPLEFAPGEQFHYSNTGYVVLSRVVEAAARQPFAEFVTATLLRPAGMSRSGVFDGRVPPVDLAVGYTHGDPGWRKTLGGVPLTAGQLERAPSTQIAALDGDYRMADGRAIFTVDAAGTALRVNMRYGGEDHIADSVPR